MNENATVSQTIMLKKITGQRGEGSKMIFMKIVVYFVTINIHEMLILIVER